MIPSAESMDPDPYAPPRNEPERRDDPPALREVVLGWERLRLLYNGLLLVPGLAVIAVWSLRQGMPLAAGLGGALVVAIGANLAFFLGPLAELYLRGLFRNGESIGRGRWLIFGAGLVVSGGLFLLVLLGGLG